MTSCSPSAKSPRPTFLQPQDLEILAHGVALAQPHAMQALYQFMAVMVGPYLVRTVGSDVARDRLHEAYLDVTTALQRGELRKPETLPGYIWAFARAHMAREVNVQVKFRQLQPLDEAVPSATLMARDPGPEMQCYNREQTRVVKDALDELPERDRAILLRYYVEEHPKEEILKDMGLTETQFRLAKSRAKIKLTELVTRKVNQFSIRKAPARELRSHQYLSKTA